MEIATEHNIYPNITVTYLRNSEGEHFGWEIFANEGFVFYDSTANDTEPSPDPDNPIPIPVTYYYTVAALPLNYNWANFPYVAVPRESVDENYNFGDKDNDHETM